MDCGVAGYDNTFGLPPAAEIFNEEVSNLIKRKIKASVARLDELSVTVDYNGEVTVDRHVVFHEEDLRPLCHVVDEFPGSAFFTAAGTTMVNCAPPSGQFSAQTRPCSAARNPRAIQRPIPVPDARVFAASPR